MPLFVAWAWENKRLIGEIAGLIAAVFVCWWFFIHNPAVIEGLEQDKAELSRQLVAGQKAIKLLTEIEQGRVKIDDAIQSQVSSLRSTARPKRTVIIRAGSVLSTVHPSNATN